MENGSIRLCDCGKNIYEKHRYSCDDCLENNTIKILDEIVLNSNRLCDSIKEYKNRNGKEEK